VYTADDIAVAIGVQVPIPDPAVRIPDAQVARDKRDLVPTLIPAGHHAKVNWTGSSLRAALDAEF
jgi:hypothetical protein